MKTHILSIVLLITSACSGGDAVLSQQAGQANMAQRQAERKVLKVTTENRIAVAKEQGKHEVESMKRAKVGTSYVKGFGEKFDDSETAGADESKKKVMPPQVEIVEKVVEKVVEKEVFNARPCSEQNLGTLYPGRNESFRNFIVYANQGCGPGTLDMPSLKEWNKHISNPNLIYTETPVCMPWRVIKECVRAKFDPTKQTW